MNSLETWDHFLSNVVLPSRLHHITQLNTFYVQHIDTLTEEITTVIDKLCKWALNRQAAGTMEECAIIRLSFLRTRLAEGAFEFLIEACDQPSIQEYNHFEFRYEAKWIYSFYEAWDQFCLTQLKTYMGVIKPWFFESWQKEQLSPFLAYSVHLVRYAMKQVVALPSYQALNKGQEFEVIVGEYGDVLLGESVYYCNRNRRKDQSLKNWLDQGLPHDYVHEHFTDADLSNTQYGGINLNYTRLQGVKLQAANWSFARMIGCQLDQCDCMYVDFSGSIMFDADFSNCNLQGASFHSIIGTRHAVNEEEAVFFGIHGMKFIGSDLTGATFQGARLTGDFRGAKLEHTDFRGADLSGSQMLYQDQEKVDLSEAQRQSILWSEM
ncbi:hypothetical protein DCC85_05250 [Paenibacillus sp. CAA11]|uniref:pentapeptide repeat-containing protein n=1 Tax=Paenibacillus sp. CAA11 TaxID=1532905 RepID=UPI000D334099|nr:pentapeptide repeat-containing protein [Paenibacillus sp. CAA11]AWB43682.1 hypothetical protein DCC85_05250 [Paenibacillus sp. CAA11]